LFYYAFWLLELITEAYGKCVLIRHGLAIAFGVLLLKLAN